MTAVWLELMVSGCFM